MCASVVIQSSTGKYFVEALWYEVVLGSTLCKLCSQSSTGKYILRKFL